MDDLAAVTVPVGMVTAFLSGTGYDFAPHLVVVGRRWEVRVAPLMADIGPDNARALASYWSAVRTWVPAPGSPFTATRLLVRSARQNTGRPKVDLVGEYRQLLTLPVAALVHAVLAPDPDVADLSRRFRDASFAADADGLRVKFSLQLPVWPDDLGGPVLSNEFSRTFTVVARSARWRDRELRRLSSLDVHANQMWPVPPTLPSPLIPTR